MDNLGSTSTIEPVSRGVVLKQPITFENDELAEKVTFAFLWSRLSSKGLDSIREL